MSSGKFKWFFIILCAAIVLVTIGCATFGPSSIPPRGSASPARPLPSPPQRAEEPIKPQIPEEQKKPEEPLSPRAVASLQMTEQGRVLLEQKKVDESISVLERAVSLNPSNGRNYYYLAEAWLLKRNIKQAEEFNSLAGLYLEGDQTWLLKVEEQKQRIQQSSFTPQ
jgi:tetratricopeptide (TPR) repeat protein